VPAAVLYDLAIGDASVRPDASMGESACAAARSGPVEEGNAGAGAGATVGKLLGAQSRMKAGVGTWSARLPSGAIVGALVATNAFGDVIDPRTGAIVAGARDSRSGAFLGTAARLASGIARDRRPFEHTTIGVVATDAPLTKAGAARLAIAAHTGLARAVSPSHTSLDGDTFFVLSTGRAPSPQEPGGSLLAEETGMDLRLALEAAVAGVIIEAILRSVRLARTAGGAPGLGG
jgi:L-aminopeptidase/D-esterase-like protein